MTKLEENIVAMIEAEGPMPLDRYSDMFRPSDAWLLHDARSLWRIW